MFCSFPIWCPGSGVVFDHIADICFLPSFNSKQKRYTLSADMCNQFAHNISILSLYICTSGSITPTDEDVSSQIKNKILSFRVSRIISVCVYAQPCINTCCLLFDTYQNIVNWPILLLFNSYLQCPEGLISVKDGDGYRCVGTYQRCFINVRLPDFIKKL